MSFTPQRRAVFVDLNFQKRSEARFFSHFDFDMCFAPQPCALFQHVNFRKSLKCSEPKVSYNILTSTRASRHSSVHFFDISTSKSAPRMRWFEHFDFQICFAPQRLAFFHLTSAQMGLRTRRFSEPIYFSTLRSHKTWEKHSVLRLSDLFAHLHLLSSDSFSSSLISFFFLSLLTLPTPAFPCVHIVGSLTSKLPSISVK